MASHPCTEKNLRLGKIDAAELFAASNGKDMNKLLGLHEVGVQDDLYDNVSNGDIYYNIVKRHKTIQDDRAQSSGAAERTAQALKNMNNPQARDAM